MNNPLNSLQTKTKVILLLIITILLVTSITLYHYLHSSTLIIQVTPTNATILVNGKSYKNGLHNLAPKSDAEITISAAGFETKTLHLSFEYGKVEKLIAYLVPENHDWSFYTKEENQESLNLLLANNGYQYWDAAESSPNLTTDQDTSANDFIKKLSLKSFIPIQLSFCGTPANRLNCDAISINYNYYPDCGNTLCLLIDGRQPNLTSEALESIRNKFTSLGFDFSNYHYFYRQSNF